MYCQEFKEWVIQEMRASSKSSIEAMYKDYATLEESSGLDSAYKKWRSLPADKKKTYKIAPKKIKSILNGMFK